MTSTVQDTTQPSTSGSGYYRWIHDFAGSSGVYYDIAGTIGPSNDASSAPLVAAAPCPWCSTEFVKVYHTGPCPRVKAIEYYPNGTVRRVEFKPAA